VDSAADDGTAVAGVLAAASNNGMGVAGVSWGSAIMPLAVVDGDDYAAYSNIVAAIQYAADHGARIINVSLGGTSPSSALQQAVDYAWSKGAVVFAAAMNAGSNTP
jgi:subtilisin family serine protease